MIVVTPWYCKSFSVEMDDIGRLHISLELKRPIKWFFRAAEGVRWALGRVKRAVL